MDSAFIARLEQILHLYALEYDEHYPVICFDERPCFLIADSVAGLEMKAGQATLIPDFLSHGAEAYGFRGDLWTCGRIAKVIKQEFGVSYHKAHVSRLLKELRWTPQKPIDRALQRDEEEIASWRVEVWPELKKKRRWNAEPLFWWTNRDSTCCQESSRPTRLVAIHRY